MFIVTKEQDSILYLGTLQQAANYNLLKKFNISAVISIGHNIPLFYQENWGIKHHIYSLGEQDNYKQCCEIFQSSSLQIHQHLQNKNVLIHCMASQMGASATIAISYLMNYQNMAYEKAFYFIKALQASINPTLQQKKFLSIYAVQLNDQTRQFNNQESGSQSHEEYFTGKSLMTTVQNSKKIDDLKGSKSKSPPSNFVEENRWNSNGKSTRQYDSQKNQQSENSLLDSQMNINEFSFQYSEMNQENIQDPQTMPFELMKALLEGDNKKSVYNVPNFTTHEEKKKKQNIFNKQISNLEALKQMGIILTRKKGNDKKISQEAQTANSIIIRSQEQSKRNQTNNSDLKKKEDYKPIFKKLHYPIPDRSINSNFKVYNKGHKPPIKEEIEVIQNIAKAQKQIEQITKKQQLPPTIRYEQLKPSRVSQDRLQGVTLNINPDFWRNKSLSQSKLDLTSFKSLNQSQQQQLRWSQRVNQPTIYQEEQQQEIMKNKSYDSVQGNKKCNAATLYKYNYNI